MSKTTDQFDKALSGEMWVVKLSAFWALTHF